MFSKGALEDTTCIWSSQVRGMKMQDGYAGSATELVLIGAAAAPNFQSLSICMWAFLLL